MVGKAVSRMGRMAVAGRRGWETDAPSSRCQNRACSQTSGHAASRYGANRSPLALTSAPRASSSGRSGS